MPPNGCCSSPEKTIFFRRTVYSQHLRLPGQGVITSYSIHYTKLYDYEWNFMYPEETIRGSWMEWQIRESDIDPDGSYDVIVESGENKLSLTNIGISATPKVYALPGRRFNPYLFGEISYNLTNLSLRNNYGRAINRVITSYSIHYTKLYDRSQTEIPPPACPSHIRWAESWYSARTACAAMPLEWEKFSNCCPSVITSYSIHYTKLYESERGGIVDQTVCG